MLNIIALCLFVLAAIIQVFYYLFFYLRLKKFEEEDNKNHLPISVIICAKNEEYNLSVNLPKILNQNYDNFEIVVIDDASDDETQDLLISFENKYKNLRHTTVPKSNKFNDGKKFAQTLGIKSAKNEYLVFTDADCEPSSDLWLQKINNKFSKNKDIILLYGKFKKTKGFLNKIIRFDAFFIAQQYLSFSLVGINYMGVGRNLAYTKSTFLNNNGFAKHLNLSSGDDDLFVNQASNKKNTTIEVSEESFTESNPKENFSAWVNQKSRHLSTAKKYKKLHKLLLIAEPISRVFLFLEVFLIVVNYNVLYSVVLLFIVFAIKIITFKKNLSVLRDKDLLLYSLIIDMILPFLNIIIFVNLKTNKHIKWK